MQKIVFLESLTKEYLILKRKRKKQSAAREYAKLGLTLLAFVGIVCWYAYTVTSGSTIGYTLQQVERSQQTAQQNYSIARHQISESTVAVSESTHDYLRTHDFASRQEQSSYTVTYPPVDETSITPETQRTPPAENDLD